MKTNQKGINLIKECEGCRLTAYKDAVGVWTIGYGHTTNVRQGDKITQAEADALLVKDIARYESTINNANEKYNYDFNENEFSALVSFAFNIGNIIQLTQNGKRSKAEIAEKMLLYVKAGGKTLPGLVSRRKRERELFLTPCDNASDQITTGYTEATTLGTVVDDVIAGNFGNGEIRERNIYNMVQKLVNARLSK